MPDPRLEHANRSSGLYSTITVCLFAIVTTTILRVAAKVKYRIPFRWDDWFMVLGTCINIVANAFNYKATASGFGRHPEYLTFDELVTTDKYLQLSVCLAVFANCAIKMSICFFLLGIIKGTHVVFVRVIWIVMAIVTATTFIGILLWGLQAKPLPKLWDPNIHGTRDSPEGFLVMVYVNESFIMFTDLFYALAPIYFLWNIQMSLNRKIQILLLTGSGILVVVVAALDLAFAHSFLNTKDSTWVLVNEFICDNIVRNMGGFVANLPALWFLFKHLQMSSSSSSTTHRTFHATDKPQHEAQNLPKLSSVVPAKSRQPDQYDLNVDECIPLKRGSFKTTSANSLGNECSAGGRLEEEDGQGVPRGWDDPTLETGYTLELDREQQKDWIGGKASI